MPKAIKKNPVLEQALAYARAGICVIPIRRDGSKRPALGEWKMYETTFPSEDEMGEWWEGPYPPGIAAVCGRVSGGLQVIDFDSEADTLLQQFLSLVEMERPDAREFFTIHRTPRDPAGYHLLFRVPGKIVPKTGKLARDRNGNEWVTLIESKAEGGYVLLPGSPGECHPTGCTYRHFAGPPLTAVRTLDLGLYDLVLRCARSLDRVRSSSFAAPNTSQSLKPGEDFEKRGPSWAEILQPHGWKLIREEGGVGYWQRPGKTGNEWSATVGKCTGQDGAALLRVFSSNACPFEEGECYGRFRAWAMLNHQGNLSNAARELSRLGYGTPTNGKATAEPTAIAGSIGVEQSGDEEKTQREMLWEIARDVSLFRTPEKVPHARVPIEKEGLKHNVVLSFNDEGMRDWFSMRLFQLYRKAPQRDALNEVCDSLAAHAKYGSPVEPVYTRIAPYGESGTVLDLAQENSRCVVVTPDGWEIREKPPVNFRRSGVLQSLPDPQRGGNIGWLWELANIRPEDRIIVACWLLMTLHPKGPYPLLCVHGEAGSGKSLTTRFIRSLFDPIYGHVRAPAKTDEDMACSANSSWIYAIENISHIDKDMSDALCRVATGGGFAKRKKYSDFDEAVIDLRRPMMLNGISEVTNAVDLASRAVLVQCPVLPPDNFVEEEMLERRFLQAQPGVMGALLSAYAAALKAIPSLPPFPKTRLVAFEKLSAAAEAPLGFEAGTFFKMYKRSRDEAAQSALEASILAQAILRLLEVRELDEWEGTAGQLLKLLNEIQLEPVRHKSWPSQPNMLSQQLTRLQPALRAVGINVEKTRDGTRANNKIVRIWKEGA